VCSSPVELVLQPVSQFSKEQARLVAHQEEEVHHLDHQEGEDHQHHLVHQEEGDLHCSFGLVVAVVPHKNYHSFEFVVELPFELVVAIALHINYHSFVLVVVVAVHQEEGDQH